MNPMRYLHLSNCQKPWFCNYSNNADVEYIFEEQQKLDYFKVMAKYKFWRLSSVFCKERKLTPVLFKAAPTKTVMKYKRIFL